MKKTALILCLALLLGLFAACGGTEKTAYVQSVGMLAGIGPVGALQRFAGIVTPQSTAGVEKRGNLEIGELKVKAGDEVREGEVLFTYDAEQSRLNLEKAKTELEQIKSNLANKEKELETLNKEKAKASKDQQLSYTLEIQETETNILELKYNKGEKEKEIGTLEESLENLEVTSPVTGRVQSLNENGGSDSMGNPLPFITLVETGRLRVKGTLSEQSASYLTEGMRVLIRSRVSEETWQGEIASIDWSNPASGGQNGYADGGFITGIMPAAESGESGAASKYPFYVSLDSDEGLLMGQHVYIEPELGGGESASEIYLDAGFFNEVESSPWVWAQGKNERLEKRSVTLGAYDEVRDAYPVLSGLDAGDAIAFPEEDLRPGMKCSPYREADAADTGAVIDGNNWGASDLTPMPDDGGMFSNAGDEAVIGRSGEEAAVASEETGGGA